MKMSRILRRVCLAAATVSVGTLPSDCEVRLHDSLVDATKATFLSLFDPANFDFGSAVEDQPDES